MRAITVSPARLRTRVRLAVLPALAAIVAGGCTVAPEAPPAALAKPLADYARAIGPEPPSFAEASEGAIEKRDTLSVALRRHGVGPAEVEEVVKALRGIFDFRNAHVGHTFEVKKDASGKLSWLRYVAGPTTIALAFRGSDGLMRGLAEPVNQQITTERVHGTIRHSLYGAMDAAGEKAELALAFVDLFAWDVDFFTETQTGDAFDILVEKRWVDGKMIGYGKVLGAQYAMVGGKTHRAFYFVHPDGTPGYYTEAGESVRKAFLKSPIQFTSITSRYGLRKHPILEYVGTHRGIDYAAPIGTAVWAVGDGVVKSAGPAGGYGNMVAIQHANGLETRYAHLKGFGAGIQRGKRVPQKAVIGYVGMTGLTTGPHLHFEVLRGGQWTNPLSVAVPPAPPIGDDERAAFQLAIQPLVAQLLAPLPAGQGAPSEAAEPSEGAEAGEGAEAHELEAGAAPIVPLQAQGAAAVLELGAPAASAGLVEQASTPATSVR